MVEERRAASVQSVDRAFAVLEALAADERPVGIAELVDLTGLPQGTVHRLLQSLHQRGYVRRDAARKYSLGTSAVRLADAAQRAMVRSARPHLAELVAISGETANLAVLEGDDVVYVAQVPSPHTLRMFAEVGRHVPPHSTAVGKVLLAGMPRERALAVLRRTGLAARTPATITDLDAFVDRAGPRHRPGLGGRRGGAGGGRALRGGPGRRPRRGPRGAVALRPRRPVRRRAHRRGWSRRCSGSPGPSPTPDRALAGTLDP